MQILSESETCFLAEKTDGVGLELWITNRGERCPGFMQIRERMEQAINWRETRQPSDDVGTWLDEVGALVRGSIAVYPD